MGRTALVTFAGVALVWCIVPLGCSTGSLEEARNANAYTVTNSCSASQGACALEASCKGTDKLWNYQACHVSGDGDSSYDDLHGDTNSSSPAPTFSDASVTLFPSSPGVDSDVYKIWGLCVPTQ